MRRCSWAGDDPLYVKYHDEEWGVENHDDYVHFEFLVLESAQAGLSWITILKKRQNYKRAYDGFDYQKVALYKEDKVEDLMQNSGIVRNRRKIEASINNAQRFIETREEFGSFDRYIWSFVDGKQIVNSYSDTGELPCSTDLSDRISKDMKKRGYSFIGTKIIYSYLQAVGIIDDHVGYCFKRTEK